MKNNKFFDYNEVLIMLHNLFLHKTKEVKRKYKKNSAKTFYLPPYSSQSGLFKRNLKWRFIYITDNKIKSKKFDIHFRVIEVKIKSKQ